MDLGIRGRVALVTGASSGIGEAVALALVSKATTTTEGPFIVDTPVAHREIGRWLEAQGAVSPRGYMRMTLGTAKKLDDPAHVFALAGPELG